MAIASFDDWIASVKQTVIYFRNGTRTSVAALWFVIRDLTGNPGVGTLAGSSTTAGVVPTDATAGHPAINDFAGGATGYLTQMEFGSTVACRLMLADMLWIGGAYSYNSAVTLSSQPSYASRLPNGSYNGLEMWVEVVTAFTGNPTITITYTNQAGTAGQSTSISATAPTLGRFIQVPLAAGDSGIQKIESVTGTVATAGTFNVVILRPLWTGRVAATNSGDVHGLDKTGMPIVFQDSALVAYVNADSTSTGVPELRFEIASK
jgi:hypothetical protein